MVQSYDLPDKAAYQAFHRQIDAEANRTNIIRGGAVSTGSQDLSVDVTTSVARIDGAYVDTSAGSDISLAASSSDPRKDVVWISHNGDGTGTIEVASGNPEPAAAPDGVNPVGEMAHRPAPPPFLNTTGVALAEIWVPANATTNDELIIYDRRLTSTVGADVVKANSLLSTQITGPVTGGEDLTTIAGDGLDIQSGSLTVTATGGDSSGSTGNTLEVVDAVADLGCDPNGGSDVGQIIHDNQAPGRIIYFPEGTYLVTTSPSIRDPECVQEDADGNVMENRFGIRGPKATFVPHEGGAFGDASGSASPTSFFRGYYQNSHVNFWLDGITWDLRASTAGHGLIKIKFGSIWMHDVDVIGEWSREDLETALVSLVPQDPTTPTIVERLRAPDGSIHQPAVDGAGASIGGSEYSAQPEGIFCDQGTPEDVTIKIIDCDVRGWPNNGIYASACPASVQVEGGVWANNDHAQIRLGGNRSYVKGARIFVDGNVDSTYDTCRGIWLREESNSNTAPTSAEETTCRVESCHISIENLPSGVNTNPQCVHVDQTMGAVTIEDTTMISELSRATPAVHIEDYDTQGGGDPLPERHTVVALRNCYVRRNGQGNGRTGVSVQRARTVLEDCTLHGVDSADTTVDIQSTGNHCRIEFCEFLGSASDIIWNGADGVLNYTQNDEQGTAPTVVTSNPTRLLTNGEGDNFGEDPRSGGPWNGNGREGVLVSWFNNGVYFAIYRRGVWRAWSADA